MEDIYFHIRLFYVLIFENENIFIMRDKGEENEKLLGNIKNLQSNKGHNKHFIRNDVFVETSN